MFPKRLIHSIRLFLRRSDKLRFTRRVPLNNAMLCGMLSRRYFFLAIVTSTDSLYQILQASSHCKLTNHGKNRSSAPYSMIMRLMWARPINRSWSLCSYWRDGTLRGGWHRIPISATFKYCVGYWENNLIEGQSRMNMCTPYYYWKRKNSYE